MVIKRVCGPKSKKAPFVVENTVDVFKVVSCSRLRIKMTTTMIMMTMIWTMRRTITDWLMKLSLPKWPSVSVRRTCSSSV